MRGVVKFQADGREHLCGRLFFLSFKQQRKTVLMFVLFRRRWFAHPEQLIAGHMVDLLNRAGRPVNFQRDLAVFSEPEVQSQIAAASVADAVGNAQDLRSFWSATDYFRSQRRSIAASSLQLHLQPMLHWAAVHPQFDRAVDGSHRDIDSPIVVEVGKGRSAVKARNRKIRSGAVGDVDEFSADVVKHSIRLKFLRIQAAASDEDVRTTIIVEIGETAAPTAPWAAEADKPGRDTRIVEGCFAVVRETARRSRRAARSSGYRGGHRHRNRGNRFPSPTAVLPSPL